MLHGAKRTRPMIRVGKEAFSRSEVVTTGIKFNLELQSTLSLSLSSRIPFVIVAEKSLSLRLTSVSIATTLLHLLRQHVTHHDSLPIHFRARFGRFYRC